MFGFDDIAAGVGLAGDVVGVAGGLADLFGWGSKKVKPHHQIRYNMEQMMASAREFGEKYGIHPLVAMGINPGSGGYANIDPGTGRKMQNLGQAMREFKETPIEASQTRLNNAKAALIEKELVPDLPGQSDAITEEDLPPPAAEQAGMVSGIQPLEMVTIDRQGFLDFFPQQNVQDYLSESAKANWKYEVMKEWTGYKDSFTHKSGRIRGQAEIDLRQRLDELEMYFPPRKGYYYAFNIKVGRPRMIRGDKYKFKKLIDNDTSTIARYSGFGSHRNR